MRIGLVLGLATASVLFVACGSDSEPEVHLNPMIALHEQGQPIFGLYEPRAGGGRGGGAATTAADRAEETLAFTQSDFIFNGSMEGSVERGMPPFLEYSAALLAGGASARTHPVVAKTANIARDPEAARANIGAQLNAGMSGLMFVGVESADEVRQGIAAMRFESQGGTRSDDIGAAASYWGLTDEEYRREADVWPLNPEGELINWTIVESHEGLTNVREIAAVEGIGVLWPGAGTLRGLFTTTGPDGERATDEEAWEAAIQQVLAACKEFDVACGYPANAGDIEMRIAQGFSVFVMNWGDGGFSAIEVGRGPQDAEPPTRRAPGSD